MTIPKKFEGVGNGPSDYFGSRRERAFDVATASVLLGPSALIGSVIALAIRIDSPGPAVIEMPRVRGTAKTEFMLKKFRSLHHGTGEQDFMVREDDGRITRMGEWIRDPGLDEIPQITQVLSGEMSMVGPRPLSSAEIDYLLETSDDKGLTRYWIELRDMVKPGLTGPAQLTRHLHGVGGVGEITEINYIETATLRDDARILGQTAMMPAVLINEKIRGLAS